MSLFADPERSWVIVATWFDGARVLRDISSSGEFWEKSHDTAKCVFQYRGKESLLFIDLRAGSQGLFAKDWRHLTEPQKERVRWLVPALGIELHVAQRGLPMRQGGFSVSSEQLEMYWLLGERLPYLWSCAALRAWVEEMEGWGRCYQE